MDYITLHHVASFTSIAINCYKTQNAKTETSQLTPHRGVTRWERGQNAPRETIHCGASKSLNNVASAFFNTVHLLPKDLRFEHGGAKLASCPGRHLTYVRP